MIGLFFVLQFVGGFIFGMGRGMRREGKREGNDLLIASIVIMGAGWVIFYLRFVKRI